MANTNRKIEEFIDGKLRSSRIERTSDNFSALLMKRIAVEHKSALEESKSDRLVKYAIGSFSMLIIGFTLVLGFISGTTSSAGSRQNGIDIGPAMETSNNYLELFLSFIQSVFVGALNFLGVTFSSRTITIVLLIALVAAVFLIGERFVLRGKLRSSGVGIK